MGENDVHGSGAFQAGAFQANAFGTVELLWNTVALAVGGTIYTAMITVVGVVVAVIPHGDVRVVLVGLYVVVAVATLVWALSEKGKHRVIGWIAALVGPTAN